MKFRALYIAAVLSLPLPMLAAQAQEAAPDVSVSVALEPAEVAYHRPAWYAIVVEAPTGLYLRPPEVEFGTQGLMVRTGATESERIDAERTRTTFSWRLETMAPGDYVLPSQTLIYGEDNEVTFPPLLLRARDLTAEERAAVQDLAPIYSPAEIAQERPANWMVWVVLAASVLLLALVLFFILRRFKAKEEEIAAPDPWEVALRRLEELRRRRLPERDHYALYYVDLSAILRYYLEDRFHLHAPEQTTPEFLETAQRSGVLDPKHQEAIAEFLTHSDRVKFAQYHPTTEEMAHSYAVVERFVRETTPAPPEAEQEEAA